MLLEILDDYFETIDPDGLEMLVDVLRDIRESPEMVADRLDAYITDLAIENDICPQCFTRMAVEQYTERYEVWGAMHFHATTRQYCPACGWG